MDWKDLSQDIGKFAPIVGSLLGGPAGAAVGGLVATALGTSNSPAAVQAALADPANALKIVQMQHDESLHLADLQSQQELAQAATNTAEAQAAQGRLQSWQAFFIAGWRPGIGWTCAISIFAAFVGIPAAQFILALFNSKIIVPMPDVTEMISLVTSMLGLAAYRTTEKLKGVAGPVS